jgi:5'-nucleotidase
MSTQAGESVVYGADLAYSRAPDLRILHYNDVYHVESGSAEPVGGAARFQTLCNYYRNDPKFKGQPELITVFSGDAFNPSLESSVTKGNNICALCFFGAKFDTGSHMVPILNNIGTDVACVGVSNVYLQRSTSCQNLV